MKSVIDYSVFDWFTYEPELEENSEILCPVCDEWSSKNEWYETEVGCEDCGSHIAIGCPVCRESFDSVYYGDEWHIFHTRVVAP
jgi:Zn finger protein HypA/HybF involved in hydrogenase expression